jgi:hypothetical protein
LDTRDSTPASSALTLLFCDTSASVCQVSGAHQYLTPAIILLYQQQQQQLEIKLKMMVFVVFICCCQLVQWPSGHSTASVSPQQSTYRFCQF